MNITILGGELVSEPTVTELPDGSVVRNYEVAATAGDGRRHVVPVAWVDASRPPGVGCGDAVVVTGAVRRRWFRAAGGAQSRTEVLAFVVAKATTRRAAAAVDAALEFVPRTGSSN